MIIFAPIKIQRWFALEQFGSTNQIFEKSWFMKLLQNSFPCSCSFLLYSINSLFDQIFANSFAEISKNLSRNKYFMCEKRLDPLGATAVLKTWI